MRYELKGYYERLDRRDQKQRTANPMKGKTSSDLFWQAKNYAKRKGYAPPDRAGFNEAYLRRRGPCDICGRVPRIGGRSHAIDHCHKSGRVRGVLCYTCNRRLVPLLERLTDLAKIVEYFRVANRLSPPPA